MVRGCGAQTTASQNRNSPWAGSVMPTKPSVGVDLFDAAPGILRTPDGRESEFIATSGGETEVGRPGRGPAPFVAQPAQGGCQLVALVGVWQQLKGNDPIILIQPDDPTDRSGSPDSTGS